MAFITDDAMNIQRYDSRTIALHWITAALIVLAWGMAQVIDFFPRGPLRVDARSVHIALGVALSVVIVLRILHRAGRGTALPAADSPALHMIAKGTHYLLYALVIAQVLLGYAFAYSRGDSIFNLFALPGIGDKELKDTIGDLHGLIANVILIVAGIHAVAALVHHYVWKDNVLRRMMPGRRNALQDGLSAPQRNQI